MANLTPFLAYVFVTTFTPGPNNIMAMTNALRYGYKRSLGFLLGMTTGFLLVMLLCGLLNVILVGLLPSIKLWLNLLGVAYMLYLAVHILLSKPVEADDPRGNGFNTFRAGFGMQFLNLKGILYGVTVFATFIVQTYQNPFIVSLFAPLLALIAFLAVSSWAIGGSLFRPLLTKYYRPFNVVMAGLLVYTAVASLWH